MASGKKNYFRHHFNASKDPKVVALIDDHGKEAYYHYFRIIELCATMASEEFPSDSRFIFRRSTLCQELRVTNSRLGHHLLAIQSSLLGEVVVTEKQVEILLPNLSKYMGTYETKFPPNISNKRKENKRKENERDIEKSDDEKFEIPDKIMQVLKVQHMYPEKIITEVSRDAWLLYLGTDSKTRNWERFLTHYFKNEKESIRKKAIEISQPNYSEMSYGEFNKILFPEQNNV